LPGKPEIFNKNLCPNNSENASFCIVLDFTIPAKMHPRLFTLMLLLQLSSGTIAASPDLRGHWTDGHMSFSGGRLNDSTWAFDGGNLHEGGYRFALRRLSDSTFFLTGAYNDGIEDKDVRPAIGERGDRVTYRSLDGQCMLVVRSPGGAISEILKPMKPDESLEDLVTRTKTAFELSGKYIEKTTGKEVIFYPNRPDADGIISTTGPYSGVYYFQTSYDFPINVITFKNNKSYYYVPTDDGLDIFTAKERQDDDWSKENKIMSLKKVYWFNLSGKAELKGNYAFASTTVLTWDILNDFTASQLKLIRNEIYARHGYAFKTDELRSYFAAQDWYRAVDTAGEGQLSDLERLNVQIIVDQVKEIPDRKE
jgi:hypothetical protein